VHQLPTRPEEPSDSAAAAVLEPVPSEQNGSGHDSVDVAHDGGDAPVVDEGETSASEEPGPQVQEADEDVLADVGTAVEIEEPTAGDIGLAEQPIEDVGPVVEVHDAGDVGVAEPPVDDIVVDEPAVACLAFAPTTKGYRLVALGSVPLAGETIDVPDVGLRLVLRVGRSPYPLDDRTCAFVEEPVTPAPAELAATL
jgi:hypothetical protein